MALVNVAAALAKSGRKVLIVDFDLEAPGLTSFKFSNESNLTPGIVEFVTEYVETSQVPDLNEFLYQVESFQETGGSLTVMPAGLQDETYEQRFASIDWEMLYEKNDGYLLMEDLRKQWEDVVNPDYVFIDSRTGFTDVAGICTRQLPNAVCLIFSPNRQNLFGLERICGSIRDQERISGLRHPRLHFVASNVPNLDDENEILAKNLREFSEHLSYNKLTATIHHYNSLALVDQGIFVLEHPKSQLSRQYTNLAEQIAKSNPEDKKSAIRFLQAAARDYPEAGDGLRAVEVDARIEEILACLGQDNEVIFWIARVYRAAGKWDLSRAFLERAVEQGFDDPQARLDLAMIKIHGSSTDKRDASDDLDSVLNRNERIKVTDLAFAIQLKLENPNVDESDISRARSISALGLEDVFFLASELNTSKKKCRIARAILLNALQTRQLSEEEQLQIIGQLALCSIPLGMLKETVAGFEGHGINLSTESIQDAFNFAMALYWLKDPRSVDYFTRVIDLAPCIDEMQEINHLQCVAFAYWAVGKPELATDFLKKSRVLALSKFHPFVFSCWNYLEVSVREFVRHLDEMSRLIEGEERAPLFLAA